MIKLKNRTTVLITLLSLMTFASSSWGSFAQDRRLAYDDWYGDAKKALADHYTGKTVKLRMAIPDTRRGLEMSDGKFERNAEQSSAQALAQPGDELTIKSFKVRGTNIEILLNKTGEQPKSRFFSRPKQPRINLHFSYELTAKDLTVESINRWLAAAVDVSALTISTAVATQPSNATQVSIAPTPEPGPKVTTTNDAQVLPTATVTADLAPVNQNIGELTIECSTGQARVYIDNAYSGFTPRTVRLRAGAYSILVMANGYAPWEQRLLVPGGKSSIAKADLRR